MDDINLIISRYKTYSSNSAIARLQRETEAIYSKRISIFGLGVKISFIDIEVYRQDTDYDDNSVHANDRQKDNFGHLYIHRYGKSADSKRSNAGVDFCWSKDKGSSYSWLLRGVTIVKDGKEKYYQGPMNVLKAIIDITGRSEDELENFEWDIIDEAAQIPFFFTKRINLGTMVNPLWREAPLRLVDASNFRERHYKACSIIVCEFIKTAKMAGLEWNEAEHLCKDLLAYIPGAVKDLYRS